ncbi:MAG: hypothetical protein R3D34_15020 [Nitratireductor sp.]
MTDRRPSTRFRAWMRAAIPMCRRALSGVGARSRRAIFTGGRGYDVPENDKYIILLTDGNNTYPNQSTWNETEYYPWGYGKDERVMDGLTSWQSEVGAMNIHTEQTCDNIKAIVDADGEAAYKIFTIAHDVSNGSSVKDLLYSCASSNSSGTKYYYDVSGDAIASYAQAIGNEISGSGGSPSGPISRQAS